MLRRWQGLSGATCGVRAVKGKRWRRRGPGRLPLVWCVHPDGYAYLFVAVLVPVRGLCRVGDGVALFQAVADAVQVDVLAARNDVAELFPAVGKGSRAGVVPWGRTDPLRFDGAVAVRGEQFMDCFA